MKLSPYRSLKKVYRQEPISAFIFIMAIADMLLGGINGHGTLLSLGIFMAMMAYFLHWLQRGKTRKSFAYNSRPRPRYRPRYRHRHHHRYSPVSHATLTPLPPLKRKRDYRSNN